MVVRNKVPFLLLLALRGRIETGKSIIVEIVPQALKRYQHEGWDWLGGHLWPHALSWHEVALAIACTWLSQNPPPFTRPSYLFPFSPPTPPPPSPNPARLLLS